MTSARITLEAVDRMRFPPLKEMYFLQPQASRKITRGARVEAKGGVPYVSPLAANVGIMSPLSQGGSACRAAKCWSSAGGRRAPEVARWFSRAGRAGGGARRGC